MGRHSSGERRSHLDAPDSGESERTGALADLRFLLHSRRILLLSLLAVVLIFGAYFLVLALLGHSHDWLLLALIPAGLSGVTVGALLDHAHRAPPTTSEPDVPEADDLPVEIDDGG